MTGFSLTDHTEVEKFVTANTQELAKDKWLCPLSGKKFKGPEFVRKHIFNKHGEKVEEVKQEVSDLKMYGCTFRGSNSFVFIFASLLNGGLTLKGKNLLL